MKKPTIKDMRTTLSVLDTLGTLVPNELKVEIARRIRQAENHKTELLLDRLSDDELFAFENRKRNILRVNLPDGRLIHLKTNDLTFEAALRELGLERLISLQVLVRRHPLVQYDSTLQRRRWTGYRYLMPGIFIYRKTTAAEKLQALMQYDEHFQLEWDVELR